MSVLDQLDRGPIDMDATVRLGELPHGFSPERWAAMSTLVGQLRLWAMPGGERLVDVREAVEAYQAKVDALPEQLPRLQRSAHIRVKPAGREAPRE